MPSYIYKAKNAAAQTITGRLNAQNQDEAFKLWTAQQVNQGAKLAIFQHGGQEPIVFNDKYLWWHEISFAFAPTRAVTSRPNPFSLGDF